MASSSSSSSSRSQRQVPILLLLVTWISIAASVAAARPCKTLWVSSYSFSLRQQPSSSGSVTVFTEISHFRPLLPADAAFFIDVDDRPELSQFQLQQQQQQPQPQPQQLLPRIQPLLSSAAADLSSLRDRTKDILSVVVALLFGVGCGALTAATMYLAWSLFSTRNDYSEEFEDADELSPKKMGYVKIPAADSKQSAAV
ncbi:hypothetical protein L484_007795 [Morus notabilis]|uniref:Uncharacterized protein n=1 Tax=Morus notabilis TaxID=981085 RepID=W9RMH5_9ROSA|nr:uncharacterized protein LOC21391187 [Morus notabilis]EXB86771.1 hypothetical protein L484_007795 [Morus notabilis]